MNYSIEKHLSRLSKGFDSAMTRMPFRYGRILDSFVVTNESGQFYFLEQPLFSQFISDPDALPFSTKQDLESKFFGYSLLMVGKNQSSIQNWEVFCYV